MNWYNGYSGKERLDKLREWNRKRRAGDAIIFDGPCMLCGDPTAKVELHSEDYSEPYSWEAPAVYWLCRHCHRDKLHKRFANKEVWIAFKAHVTRGGYARDLKDKQIKAEFAAYVDTLKGGQPRVNLKPLNQGARSTVDMWWDRLTLDEASLTATWARPRP